MERKILCLLALLLVIAAAAGSWSWTEDTEATSGETLATFPLDEAVTEAESMTSEVTTLSVSSGGQQLSCMCTPVKGGTFPSQPSQPSQPSKPSQPELNPQDACWKRSNGRGVGVPLSTCKSGFDKNGALCYPKCNSGYTGAGPVCWQNCPAGYQDDGAFCRKLASSYGRGAGYALWDEGKCIKENPQGCEKNGLMFYPKCRAGYNPVGCCICSPTCINGMKDIGVSCQKGSYGRGVGEKMNCASGLQEDAGLCYKSCPSGFNSVGPICWQRCPSSRPFECGALCTKDSSVCTETVKGMVLDTISAVTKLAQKNPEGAYDTAKAAFNFVLPLCSQ